MPAAQPPRDRRPDRDPDRPLADHLTPAESATLRRWAALTWRSLEAMTDPSTGLPADNIPADLDPRRRSGYTSPTNIGGLLWSTVVARDLGVLDAGTARDRLQRTLTTLGRLEHHEPTGMLWNWYDESDGAVVRERDGEPVQPFASSVDNGWLAVGLHVVAAAEPSLAGTARALTDRMRWQVFLDPAAGPAGLLRNGFWLDPPPGRAVEQGDHSGQGLPLAYQAEHYDTAVSETRIVSYLGIADGSFPAQHYFSAFRGFPPEYRQVDPPLVGFRAEHLGVPVFEGAREHRGLRVVPGWGGSMFEELMVDLFVPEEQWGPASWGVNHPLHVRAQREHGLLETGYGYWGFSPASSPPDGYDVYGVDALGLDPQGYRSDDGAPPGGGWGDGVVTPHAAFLALLHEPAAAFATLSDLAADFPVLGPGGFADSVAVRSGRVAARHLSLDQAMVLAACGVLLAEQTGTPGPRGWFCCTPGIERLRPLMAAERFAAGVGPLS